MTHLTNDKFRRLAKLVMQDLAFTADDVHDMKHIGECEACFRKLQRYMTVMEAVDHIAAYAKIETQDNAAEAPSTGANAVIKVVIYNAFAILEQLSSQAAAWEFDAPLSMAARGSGKENGSAKLEDIDNSKTFVAYEPSTRTLVIQIDCSQGNPPAKAWIKMPDGSMRDVAFEKREGLLWAEIHDLDEGEYEVILDK